MSLAEDILTYKPASHGTGGIARHFTHLADLPRETVTQLVDYAIYLKREKSGAKPLDGKKVAYLFMNPSLRTRVSFETATIDLGGHPITLDVGAQTWKMEFEDAAVMDGGAVEHARDAVPVLGRFFDAVALRSFPEGKMWKDDREEPALSAFRKLSPVPVINMESALEHPCQGLADLMTIKERMEPAGKKFVLTWAPHVKALPHAVPHSAALAAAMAGMNVTIAHPEGFELDYRTMKTVKELCKTAGTEYLETDNPEEAYRDADVVYAKSWGSISDYGTPPPSDAAFRAKWIADEKKMATTKNAIFMHCLPVRRNLEVAAAVLDGPQSVTTDQAENRYHTSKAVLLWLLHGNA